MNPFESKPDPFSSQHSQNSDKAQLAEVVFADADHTLPTYTNSPQAA